MPTFRRYVSVRLFLEGDYPDLETALYALRLRTGDIRAEWQAVDDEEFNVIDEKGRPWPLHHFYSEEQIEAAEHAYRND